ncbi:MULTISPECIES: carbohydrate ABC transporter permease [Pseudofrankia]|uniref:carbohydrate ABC transporter permease n=1 Tax=Pseudofrankia TaxID=2994363 RepID=UPI000565E7F5|nr:MULTISPECIES: sugar ABC transporter permease [Pseudofrankia]
MSSAGGVGKRGSPATRSRVPRRTILPGRPPPGQGRAEKGPAEAPARRRRPGRGGWLGRGERPGRRALGDGLVGWAMVSPSVLLIGLFGLVPVIWSFVLSFQNNDLQTPATSAGFANYRDLVHDDVFLAAVRRTLLYTAVFVPVTLLLSLLAAAALNRRIRGMSVYRLAFFIPVVTSTVATGVVFTWLLDPAYGLINTLLAKVGLPTSGFFASPHAALLSVVAMTVWGWVGFGTLIYLAGLQGVPGDVIEAAQIDGCSKAGAFWRIQVPLLRPVTGFLAVWLTINALQLFDEVYVTTRGGPLNATNVVVYYLYKQAFELFHAGYAAAMATALFLIIALVTWAQTRLTRDVSAGGRS